MFTPILSPQIFSCSDAAALKVSAAANITLLPWAFSIFPSFAIEVVFPPPFIPITRIISGVLSQSLHLSPLFKISVITFVSASLTLSGFVIWLIWIWSRRSCIILIVVSIPISEVIRISSSSSSISSSTVARDIRVSLILSDSFPKKPFFFPPKIAIFPPYSISKSSPSLKLSTLDIPCSGMVTPYSTSACSIVAFW